MFIVLLFSLAAANAVNSQCLGAGGTRFARIENPQNLVTDEVIFVETTTVNCDPNTCHSTGTLRIAANNFGPLPPDPTFQLPAVYGVSCSEPVGSYLTQCGTTNYSLIDTVGNLLGSVLVFAHDNLSEDNTVVLLPDYDNPGHYFLEFYPCPFPHGLKKRDADTKAKRAPPVVFSSFAAAAVAGSE